MAAKRSPKTSSRSPLPRKAKDFDEYLSALPRDVRSALQRLRTIIRAAAPRATEAIRYQMPTFVLGRSLVCFAAFANHCSFFVMSTKVMKVHAAELARYETSKGTIRFSVERPLPAALVKKLVKARIAEIEQK